MNSTTFHMNFIMNMNTANDVHQLAAFGASRKADRINELLHKFDEQEKNDIALSRDDVFTCLKEIVTVDNEGETFDAYLPKEDAPDAPLAEWKDLRITLKNDHKTATNIPRLSRENSIISMASLFEFFVNDLFEKVFSNNRDKLADGRINLDIKELIESLDNETTINIIIREKVNGLRNGIIKKLKKLKKLGIQITIPMDIKELYLVRNCLVHNSKLVDKKLVETLNDPRYVVDTEIDITEKDYFRFYSALRVFSYQVYKQYLLLR